MPGRISSLRFRLRASAIAVAVPPMLTWEGDGDDVPVLPDQSAQTVNNDAVNEYQDSDKGQQHCRQLAVLDQGRHIAISANDRQEQVDTQQTRQLVPFQAMYCGDLRQHQGNGCEPDDGGDEREQAVKPPDILTPAMLTSSKNARSKGATCALSDKWAW